jgi:bifunctional non-homologous end joining protein LigD
MLHFGPAEPAGHVESIPNVHFIEHTGCMTMSIVPVHTMLSHSVDVSLTVTHAAPNVRSPGPAASAGAGESPEHAARTSEQTRAKRCMARDVTPGPLTRIVTAVLQRLTCGSPALSWRDRSYAGPVEYAFGEITVVCSNVDRVMFPADGITKGELIAYYRDVADLMVPELSGRPLSVVRYTKGIDRGGFFQKHYQKHFPAWIDRVAAGAKTVVEYPIVDSPAGVVYFANQGSIEFHVWTSRKDALDRPDMLVFDLDPPEGPPESRFDLVRRTAGWLRAVLEELALPAFVKLTGSKGAHVVAPLDDAATFDEVGELATRIGALLCRRHPNDLTMEFYKKDRRGRLFVDVMRNAIGATLVAPYSLRGRPGAPVSAPIGWSELDDPALRADGIRMRDLRARLDRRGDPWRDLRAGVGSVSAALRAVTNLAVG